MSLFFFVFLLLLLLLFPFNKWFYSVFFHQNMNPLEVGILFIFYIFSFHLIWWIGKPFHKLLLNEHMDNWKNQFFCGQHAHYYGRPTRYQILCWPLHIYFSHNSSAIHVFPPFYKWGDWNCQSIINISMNMYC